MGRHQQLIGSQASFLQFNSNDNPFGEASQIQCLRNQNTKEGVNIFIDGAWQQGAKRENKKTYWTR